ncbi:MAG: hypothetical protein WAW37_02515 [Syntrophobacteraceae bacterium]
MDPFEELTRQIGELRAEIAELKGEVQRLSTLSGEAGRPIEMLLRQRGLPVIAHGGQSQLVFPPHISTGRLGNFYRLMRRYSFRLFMRDLIQVPEGSGLKDLTRYCSLKTVRLYLNALADIGIVSLVPGGYALVKRVPSFGATLEWYVSEIFRREFLAPALFNVRLQNTKFGGDYDVVSTIADRLVYVEVKSSPPRGVEHQAVNAFLGRVGDLEPHVSILFVDTELRMKDKLVPLLADGLILEGKAGPQWEVSRLVDEIFHVRHAIYLINSRKGVYSNLRTCFRDFLLWERKDRKRA